MIVGFEQIEDLNPLSIGISVSNSENIFGGGWKASNSTAVIPANHIYEVCNTSGLWTEFQECFNNNTFNANETITEVIIKNQLIDLDSLSTQVYEFWSSKIHILNHTLADEEETFEIRFNNDPNLEYFLRY